MYGALVLFAIGSTLMIAAGAEPLLMEFRGDRVKRDTFSFGDMDSALVGAQRPRFGKRVVPEHLMPAASDYGWGSDGLDKRYGASSGFLEGFNDLEGMQRPRFGRRR